ncbi:MAG: Fe2+-dependent dioxygenase [Akkermansiaceae bacterium]|nr:Fe2+-dependent dioxygenase [Akkermansiaceae bacterium]
MIVLPDVLTAEEVAAIRDALAIATFEDGKLTAFGPAREAKNNPQLEREGTEANDLDTVLLTALSLHQLLQTWAQPSRTTLPLINNDGPGMEYGMHVDSAFTPFGDPLRRDIFITLFLSELDSYEGGELVVETQGCPKKVKLQAGQAFAYTTNALHFVKPVKSGNRLAAVFWLQSLIHDNQIRQSLFELTAATSALREQLPKHPAFQMLGKVHQNLTRKFAQP